MQSSIKFVISSLVMATFWCNPAAAQLTGNSSSITPVAPSAAGANNPAFGAGTTISEGESTMSDLSRTELGSRIQRQVRAPRDFVGRSRSDINSFVGAQQALAVGRVRSATEGLRPTNTNAERANRPIPPQPKKGLYYPKLQLASLDRNYDVENNAENSTSNERNPMVDAKLLDRVSRVGGSSVQISLSGSVATLSGQVDSARTGDIVMYLLSFEPGIDQVINRLSVAKPTP